MPPIAENRRSHFDVPFTAVVDAISWPRPIDHIVIFIHAMGYAILPAWTATLRIRLAMRGANWPEHTCMVIVEQNVGLVVKRQLASAQCLEILQQWFQFKHDCHIFS